MRVYVVKYTLHKDLLQKCNSVNCLEKTIFSIVKLSLDSTKAVLKQSFVIRED